MDSKLWDRFGTELARNIARHAILLFAEHGFNATRTREITQRAGYSQAALYVAFESKEAILFQMSKVAHLDIFEALSSQTRPDASAPDQLRTLVTELVTWHARHHRVAQVIQYEMRALRDDHRREIAAIRNEIEGITRRVLVAGSDEGVFQLRADLDTTNRIVISVSVDVSRWYSSSAALSPDALGSAISDMVVNMLLTK